MICNDWLHNAHVTTPAVDRFVSSGRVYKKNRNVTKFSSTFLISKPPLETIVSILGLCRDKHSNAMMVTTVFKCAAALFCIIEMLSHDKTLPSSGATKKCEIMKFNPFESFICGDMKMCGCSLAWYAHGTGEINTFCAQRPTLCCALH